MANFLTSLTIFILSLQVFAKYLQNATPLDVLASEELTDDNKFPHALCSKAVSLLLRHLFDRVVQTLQVVQTFQKLLRVVQTQTSILGPKGITLTVFGCLEGQ